VSVPVTPRRIHAWLAEAEPPRPTVPGREEIAASAEGGRNLRGQGSFEVPAPPAVVWRSLLDPESLKAVIPGCHELQRLGENDYRALVSLGVGPVRGKFEATVKLSDLVTEKFGRIGGTLSGPLGDTSGSGNLRLEKIASGTRIDYDYAVTATGKVVAVGGRLLDRAAALIIRQFFERLARQLNPEAGPAAGRTSLWQRFLNFLRSLGGGGA